ncbi:MAG: Asp23/Gls24 family envelope stress response protein [Ruminococcaceae bacterium]|nr:Asp23/Gls24 family envelope stress response protein [Oscillospiraceae bacterium]
MTDKITRSTASLKISNEVLVKIAEVAATEIKGVASEGERLVVNDKGVQIAGKFMSPVKAVLKNEAVEITVSIIVLQGYKASAVAQAVQKSVKSAIQNMANVTVSKVNVKIADIMLSNPTE